MAKRHTLFQNLQRLFRKRLVVPMIRSPHPVEHTALGAAIGTMWAMTPLVGIQMWIVTMNWLAFKKFFHKSFSLPMGLACTWITNVFTMVPAYYIFYVTGQLMMGHFDNISGYQHLKDIIHTTFMGELSFSEQWGMFFKLLVKDWGVAMLVGSIPWMITGYVGAYWFVKKFLTNYRALREKRRLHKLQKRLNKLHKDDEYK